MSGAFWPIKHDAFIALQSFDCVMMSNRQEYVETDECCMFLDRELSGYPTEVFRKISVPQWNSARTPKQLCESWRKWDCEESEIRRKFCETPVFEEPFAHGGVRLPEKLDGSAWPASQNAYAIFDYLWPKWSAIFPTLYMNWPKIVTLSFPHHKQQQQQQQQQHLFIPKRKDKSNKNKRPSQFNVSFPIARPTQFFGKVKKKSRLTCKEVSTLIYKHTILSY